MPNALVVAEPAFAMLADDCRAHPDTETGGVLLGEVRADAIVATFAVPAGRRAHRSGSGFRPDVASQQRHLDFLHSRFGTDYVGDYHRHPGSYDRPSTTDLATARRIVTSRRWNKPVAVFPIVVIEHDVIRMRAWVITRESNTFTEIPVEVVPDTDPRVRAVILREPVDKGGEHATKQSPRRRRGSDRASSFLRRLAARLWPRSARRRTRPGPRRRVNLRRAAHARRRRQPV